MLKGLILRSTLVAFVCSVSVAVHAMADPNVQVNVPPGELSTALAMLAKQTGAEFVYQADQVRGLHTNGVTGNHSAPDAVRILLKDTSLELRVDASGAMLIAAPQAHAAGDSQKAGSNTTPKEGKTGSSQDFRVAQVDSGQTSNPSAVDDADREGSKTRPMQLEEVIITGSRIALSAGQQSIQPVRSYSRQDIASSGQTTVGEFMNTLPDVSNFISPLLSTIAGVEAVRLHGLPAGTTLTLLDGRRVEKSSLGFFDLSSLPTAAVERVEILPVGASAIYGSDALAGAVNFILRKDFSGLEVNANLDHAPGVSDPSMNLAWGVNGDGNSISVIANYEYRGALLGTQRAPTSSTNFPASYLALGLVTDRCAPGNVYSTDGTNLPGLNSPQAGIPVGVTGVPAIQQFQGSAGRLNLCNNYEFNDITAESQRESVLLSAHYQLAQSADLFTETLLSHKTLKNQIGPQYATYAAFDGTVAANNPYNPFGEAVNVSSSYPGAGTLEFQSSSLIRPTIGVRGAVFSGWGYEATVTFSRDQLNDHALGADFGQIGAALASADPTTALNPFTSGPPGSPQLLNSLVTPVGTNPNSVSNVFDDRLVNAEAVVRGPAIKLPAGPAQVAIGAYVEQEKQYSAAFGGTPAELRRHGYAAFAETRVPLVSSSAQNDANERLALTAATRYDHSNDFGGKVTWQGGLLWRAGGGLSLRGSYGQSYQAPPLADIAGAQTIFVGPIFGGIDPFRGNEPINYPVTNVFGPNFGLKPQTGSATAFTLGYSGELSHRPNISLTWYDLKISNYIGGQGAQVLIDNPNLFPGAVVRAPASAQDQQSGFLGVITRVNQTFYNYGDLRVTGFDADLRFPIDTHVGQITPSLAISNVYRWESALVPGAPTITGVSAANLYGVGWAPRWKGTVALAWKSGPLALNVDGRYVGRYLDYQDFGPTARETGNTWLIDANARYEFAGSRS